MWLSATVDFFPAMDYSYAEKILQWPFMTFWLAGETSYGIFNARSRLRIESYHGWLK